MTKPTRFTSTDPELPPGSIVKDAKGDLWTRDYDTPIGGRHAWHPIDDRGEPRNDDPESWTRVAGNYGPVTMLAQVLLRDSPDERQAGG